MLSASDAGNSRGIRVASEHDLRHGSEPVRVLAPDGTAVGDTDVGLGPDELRDMLRWMLLARRLDRSLQLALQLVRAGQELLDRAELLHEARRRLLAHARDAGDVVRCVPLQRHVVEVALGREAEPLRDGLRIVAADVRDALHVEHHGDPVTDELEEVTVGGHDHRLDPFRASADRERRDEGGRAPDDAELLAGHLPERAAAAPHREEHDEVVLHRAGEDDADDDPERARQVAHLGCEDRADERSGTGDGREVVAEEDAPVRRHEVLGVVVVLRRRRAGVVRLRDVALDVLGVEAERDEIAADCGEDEPDRVDRFTARKGEHAPTDAAQQRNGDPNNNLGRRPLVLLGLGGRIQGHRREIRILHQQVGIRVLSGLPGQGSGGFLTHHAPPSWNADAINDAP